VGKKLYAEAEAAAALVKGHEEGLNFFFELYYTPLIWFSLRLTSDQSAAEDIVTEAFLRLWNTRGDIYNSGYIKRYLYRIVQNLAMDFVRKKRRTDVRDKELSYLSPISEESIQARLIETEFHHQIFLSLKQLPPRMARVFRMFYLQGKSYRQIAEELKISIHTVRNQRSRAIELIRQHVLLLVATLLSVNFLN
jgi:RNA polymerase sigma-70 factor (ECF subfamily)